MVNQELADYIRVSLEKGHTRPSVLRELKNAGWPASEINSAFSQIEDESPPVPQNVPRRGFSARQEQVAGGPGSGYHSKFFNLQEREGIVFESRPLKGLFWYYFLGSLIGLFFLTFLFGLWLGLPVLFILVALNPSQFLTNAIITGFVIFIVFLVIDILIVRRKYKMMYYWITTQRIVIKKGLIGYSINSIPFERISDALISRSFLERIFGFGSLHLQTLAGQYSMGRGGAEGNLVAVPNPEDTQALIAKLIRQRREQAHLTI
jgi:membrane protein YdbS with pleckstrin-like domain